MKTRGSASKLARQLLKSERPLKRLPHHMCNEELNGKLLYFKCQALFIYLRAKNKLIYSYVVFVI